MKANWFKREKWIYCLHPAAVIVLGTTTECPPHGDKYQRRILIIRRPCAIFFQRCQKELFRRNKFDGISYLTFFILWSLILTQKYVAIWRHSYLIFVDFGTPLYYSRPWKNAWVRNKLNKIGQNRPHFCVLYAKKYTDLKKKKYTTAGCDNCDKYQDWRHLMVILKKSYKVSH